MRVEKKERDRKKERERERERETERKSYVMPRYSLRWISGGAGIVHWTCL